MVRQRVLRSGSPPPRPALALLLVLGALSAVGCGPSGPTGEGFELVGYVLEARGPGATGPPIANAHVRFESDTGRSVEGTSAGNGRYRLFIVTDTPYGQVSASAPGYLEARRSVYFDAPSRRIDVILTRVPDGSP